MSCRPAALLTLTLAVGCGRSSSEGVRNGEPGGSTGVGATGGGPPSSGASGGGAPNAGAPSGGITSGGSAGAASGGDSGGAGNGGTAGEAGAPPSAGSGGSSADGGVGGAGANGGSAAGSGGSGASGGSAPTGPLPSAACANGDATPETRLPIQFEPRILLPPGYDGSTPLPVLFDFHESGGSSPFLFEVAEDHPILQSYVVVAPRHTVSVGGFSNEDPEVFLPLFDGVSEAICVDRNNVFVAGLASGAVFHNRLLAYEQTKHLFRAAVSVGAVGRGYNTRPIPHLFIHGLDDTLDAQANDADGLKAIARYATSNGCAMTSTPRPVASCMSGTVEVTPGCVEYEGCAEPLVFCSHDDPYRNGRNDGWPCFASDLVYEFLEANRR